MAKVFISYRRADTLDMVGRLFDTLQRRAKGLDVFRDIDSVPPGVDFRTYVQDWVGRCDVVLVAIGRAWFETTDTGARRIDDPDDFVRLEIEAALARNVPVIPIYVGGVDPPVPEDLPPPIRNLAYRNGLRLRSDPDFKADCAKIAKAVRGRVRRGAGRPLTLAAVAIAALVAGGTAVYYKDAIVSVISGARPPAAGSGGADASGGTAGSGSQAASLSSAGPSAPNAAAAPTNAPASAQNCDGVAFIDMSTLPFRVLCDGPDVDADVRDWREAVAASDAALAVYDAGRYGEIWDSFLSDIYKDSLPSRDVFVSQTAFGMGALGVMNERVLTNVDYADQDAATGLEIELYGVNYRTRYQNGDFLERVVMVVEDGSLKIGGMFGVPTPQE